MFDELALLWFAAVPLVGSPGPATLSLAAMGSAYGVRASLGYLAGIVGGTALVMVILASGLGGALVVAPELLPVITTAAVLYILYLAWRIASAPPLSRGERQAGRPSVRGALFLALTNPKAYAALGALLGSNTVIEGNVVLDGTVKVVALTVLILIVDVVWLNIGSALSRTLADPRLGRAINIVFAVLLVGSVALALLT
jgi:threonine/homoserine/homoserine lactone efflux protein